MTQTQPGRKVCRVVSFGLWDREMRIEKIVHPDLYAGAQQTDGQEFFVFTSQNAIHKTAICGGKHRKIRKWYSILQSFVII